MSAKTIIESGKAILGIEFGSTRIKAVFVRTPKITLSHRVALSGKTSWWMASGLTASTPSGKVCRICYADLRKKRKG